MKKSGSLIEPLTKRELEILSFLAANYANKEIAASLNLSLNSIKWFTRQIYNKLGVENRLQAVAKAGELGLLVAGKSTDVEKILPLRAAGISHPNNLPVQLTSFVGREKEIADLVRLFLEGQAHLVTITGSGGTGKTRLALQVAEQLLKQFPQGVWLIEMAPLSDPALLPGLFAEVLGQRIEPKRSIAQVLVEYLKSRQTLLILDNCEHVVRETAALANKLLRACPQLRILATSREILGVEGEIPFDCPSLSLPNTRHLPPLAELAQFEAVRLFTERAQTISPTFAITDTNAADVARICLRLDGIPLAIELAAARLRLLSVEQIASRLDHAFRLLTGGSRSVLPHHQTLKALIDWSYDLLSQEERILLLRLAVFAGSWTLDAAEYVCIDPEEEPARQAPQSSFRLLPEGIMDLLGLLIDKSIIRLEHLQGEEPRYRMLETVRLYAQDRLFEHGGVEKVRERHLDYFLSLALQTEPHIRAKDARRWLDRLDRELGNLRLALEWSLFGSVEKGLRLAAALMWFWHVRNYRAEGVEWLDKLLEAEETQRGSHPVDQAGRIARGKALIALSGLIGRLSRGFDQRRGKKELSEESKTIFQSLYDEATGVGGEGAAAVVYQRDLALSLYNLAETEQECLECRNLFLALSDPFYTAECDLQLFNFSLLKNDFEKANFYIEENLALRKEIGDLDGEGSALFTLAMMEFYQGKLPRAIELAKKSLACFETVGNSVAAADFSLVTLCLIALAQGNYQQAAQQIEMQRSFGLERNSQYFLMNALASDGFLAWANREYGQAVQHSEEALALTREFQLPPNKLALYVLARVALSQGEYARARACLMDLIINTEVQSRFTGYLIWPPEFLVIQTLGVLAAAEQQAQQAAVLFGAQESLCAWVRNILSPPERSEFEHALASARANLGEVAFAAAWEEGRSMTEEQVMRYIRQTSPLDFTL
jgi:predicted ATPase/DNA-binding CsgD family transcriptional regulator